MLTCGHVQVDVAVTQVPIAHHPDRVLLHPLPHILHQAIHLSHWQAHVILVRLACTTQLFVHSSSDVSPLPHNHTWHRLETRQSICVIDGPGFHVEVCTSGSTACYGLEGLEI